MSRDSEEVDPEGILDRRDRRVSRQGHAAVTGALTTSALAVSVLAVAAALGLVGSSALYPAFMLVAPGALGGVWLNATLIGRVDRPVTWFRRIASAGLGVDAVLFVVALAVGGAATTTVQVLAAFFAIAWLGGVAAAWRFT